MLPSSQNDTLHTTPLRAVPKFYNLGNKDTKCNLVTSHFWQLPKVSHNSRVTVKFIEAAHNQTAFHRKDAEMEGEGAERGRPE